MRLMILVVSLLSACAQQVVGGGCRYEEFHGTCRFVSLEHGGTAFYALDEQQLGVRLSFDDDRFAPFEAHLLAHPDLPCAGQRIVQGSCVPMIGTVDIPPFDGVTLVR